MAQKILFKTSLTETASTDVEGVGTLRFEEDGKVYRWVQANTATDFLEGQAVCYDIAGGTGSLTSILETVLHASDTNLGLFAGITMTAMETGDYGWIQVYGFHADAKVLAGTGSLFTAGASLKCNTGTNTGTAASASLLMDDVALGSSPTYPSYAIALESHSGTAADAIVDYNVFIRAL